MAIGAVHPLGGRMFAVAEHGPENIAARRGASVRRELVTNIARSDLGLRCMTRVAIRMGLYSDRNSFAGAGGLVTRRAAFAGQAFSGVVSRVIKFHIESLDKARREFLYRRRNRIHIGMTNRAHRLLIRTGELTDVTADARVVSRIFQVAFAFATMTRCAFELFVLRDLM